MSHFALHLKILKSFLSLFQNHSLLLRCCFFSSPRARLLVFIGSDTPFAFKIMARTRGLGRAIDRLIGRDRQHDHDAVDVPERRRLTASAHRQRVHQMTVDAPDMAEDVPDMTEDVPDMAEDAPEMTVDIQGDDGAEGSHADDAEGFLGGPRDPSVLTSFADHVAHAVWSGQVF
ncbi:hypothetical protein GmHk_12G034487 [Glycine max]|nr:hypothetical protein GmHk_12G034487 [Glycine max]